MTTVGEAFVAIRPEGSNFASEAEKLIAGGLGPAAAKAATIVGGIFVGREAINFAKEGVTRLEEIEKTATITAARLKATGEAAGESQQQIEGLAKAQQDLAGTDRELIQQGENVLLGFQKIKSQGGVFDQTVRDATDLSVALGQDFPAAARNLGRSLEDPTKASRALRAENVILTASENEQIKAFVAAGDVVSAQEVILKKVEGQVGGTAKAYGETLGGQLAKAKINITDAKASLVEGLAPGLELTATVAGAAAQSIQDLPGPLRETASVALGAGAAYVALARPISAAIQLGGQLKGIFGGTAAAQEADAAATASDAEAKTAATAALTAHTAALEANTAALGGTVVAEEATAVATDALVVSDTALVAVAPAVVAAEEEIGAGATAMLGPIGLAVAAIGAAVVAFKTLGGGSSEFNIDLKGAVPSIQDFTSHLDEIRQGANLTGTSLATVASDIAKQSIPAARNFNDALRAQGLSTDEVTAAIDRQDAANKAAAAGQKGRTVDAQALSDAEDALAAAEKSVDTAQQSRLDAITGSLTAERSYRDAVISSQDAVRGLADAQASLKTAQQALNDAQRLSPAEDNAKAELGLSDARFRQRDASQAVLDAQTTLDDLRKSGKGTVETLGTAELKLSEAKNANTAATFAITDAERTLQNIQADGTAAEQAVASATKGVEDAKKSVNDAYRKETDSTVAQADALAKLRIEQLKATGVTVDAQRQTDIYTQSYRELQRVIAPGSPLSQSFDHVLSQLGKIRSLSGDTFAAIGNLAQLQGQSGDAVGLAQTSILLLKKLGIIASAAGFSGEVNQPTLFLAGEAGREKVNITPDGQSSGQGGGPVFGPGSIVVQFVGVVPTPDQALGVGRNVGAGIAQMTRDVRVAVGTR